MWLVIPQMLGFITDMRNIILLILLSTSLAAADTGVQVYSSVSTNSETGAVLTTETFTRSGQTNLVRVTKSQRGVAVFRNQRFCHNGELAALFTFQEGVQSFHTFPSTSYYVDLEFLPSNEVRCLMIQGKGFIDGFYPTNGVYYPAPDSDLKMHSVK